MYKVHAYVLIKVLSHEHKFFSQKCYHTMTNYPFLSVTNTLKLNVTFAMYLNQ